MKHRQSKKGSLGFRKKYDERNVRGIQWLSIAISKVEGGLNAISFSNSIFWLLL
jgi:hypothetical protein